MCSSSSNTKAASPANQKASGFVKPAPATGGGGGGGGGGGTPPPIKFSGDQEHVPELTFIVEPRVLPDDYLAGATTYHSNCGLQPQQIHSIDHMLDRIATGTTPLKRIRLVSHANDNDIIVPMFGQTTIQADHHTFREHLEAFADSDELGLLVLIDLNMSSDYHVWNLSAIMSLVRTANANLLQPFGFDSTGVPDGDLGRYIRYACDSAFVNRNLFQRNHLNLPAAERAGLQKALTSLMRIRAKKIDGKTFGTHTATSGEVNALGDYLKQRTATELNVGTPDIYNFDAPAGTLNTFLLAGFAADAVDLGFRAKLDKVRARFSSAASIDVRGCRIGQDQPYMRALQTFMGQPGNVPQVTGPQWYQVFAGTNSYHHPNSNAQIHTLLQNGAPAANIRAGFATWLTMVGMDPAHTKLWSDTLTGPAVNFCLPDWRKTIPVLPVATPGIDTFKTMQFPDAMNAVAEFFNVATAARPAAAQLNTINSFITGKLMGWGPTLLAGVDSSTDASKLTSLYNAMKPINQDLGQSIVPATPPSPLQASDIKGWQTQLISFIDGNQLAVAKTFMTAVKQRIDDTTDPGIYYYALRSGIPVFIFAPQEQVVAHRVNIQNHRLVVFDVFADQAYRQWPLLLWTEPLPSGNTIGSLHAADLDARRFAMMVEQPDGGNVSVAACPNPAYFNRITTV